MSAEDTPPEKKAPYEVGYGKPPKSGQFRKGQSGNPKGRRKKSKSLADWDDILLEKARASIKGKTGDVTVLEIWLQKMLAKAVQGKLGALKELAEVLDRYDATEAGSEDSQIGGVLRQRLMFMPLRMEEILISLSGRKPWSAENLCKARGLYFAGSPPRSEEARRDLIVEYPDLEEGSERAAEAYYAEQRRKQERASQNKRAEMTSDPVKEIVQKFARQMHSIKDGGKTRRLSTYRLMQLLLRNRVADGEAGAVRLVTKLAGKTTAGGRTKPQSLGVMRAPPEQPLSRLEWDIETHNAHNERPPTIESIMLPAQLRIAELRSAETGEPLPPWFAAKVACLTELHRLSPEAEARIEWLKQNPPDPYLKYRHLRPKGWRAPEPISKWLSSYVMRSDSAPPPPPRNPARPVAPKSAPVDIPKAIAELEEKRRLTEARFEDEARVLPKEASRIDYYRRRRETLRAIDDEVERLKQMEDPYVRLARLRQDARDALGLKDDPPPPPSRRHTFR